MFASEFAIYLYLKRRPQLNSAPCDKLHSRGTTAQGAPAGMQPVHSVHKWGSNTKTHLWVQALGKNRLSPIQSHSWRLCWTWVTWTQSWTVTPWGHCSLQSTREFYRMFWVKLTLRSSLIIQPADKHSSIITIQYWWFSSCMDKQLWQHKKTLPLHLYIKYEALRKWHHWPSWAQITELA